MNSSRIYVELYREGNRGRRYETPGSRLRPEGSLTRESPRAGTRGTGRCTGGGWKK